MIYVERKPLQIEACKFTGEITTELRSLGVLSTAEAHINEGQVCPLCSLTLKNHGLYRVGNSYQPICPGNYIIYDKSNGIQLMSASNFESLYRPLCSTIVDVPYEDVVVAQES